MNMKLGLLGLTMAGVAMLVVSCGSSSSDNPTTTGGSSTTGNGGKAGASTAGTSNSSSGSSSGGKASNNGGSANNNGGSANSNGGNTNNGGFTFGGFNFGGAGPDLGMFMCDPVPQTGSACTSNSQPCLNGTEVCYCQMDKWACTDIFGGAGGAGPNFGDLDCPEAKPMEGADCGDTVGFCPYGQNMGCACYNGSWACSP
jgi:hypothetical protein